MFRGLLCCGGPPVSRPASPQASASSRRKEVHQVTDFLYEFYKPERTPTLQVVFFHGLSSVDLSNAHVSTWKSEDESCVWPQEWLPSTFPRAHIFTVSYSASAKIFDLYLLGENLVSDLLQAGIGQITSCPVILVGHCVGGLVIKEVCCRAHENLHSHRALPSLKEKLEKYLQNTRGIFYYCTPHHGSSIIAKATDAPLFQFFKTLNGNATRLSFKFEGVQSQYKWLTFGLPTLSRLPRRSYVVVVPEASSRQGDDFLMVLADHYSICQPRSKIDTRFSHLKNLIDTSTITLEEDPEAIVQGDHHLNCVQMLWGRCGKC